MWAALMIAAHPHTLQPAAALAAAVAAVAAGTATNRRSCIPSTGLVRKQSNTQCLGAVALHISGTARVLRCFSFLRGPQCLAQYKYNH